MQWTVSHHCWTNHVRPAQPVPRGQMKAGDMHAIAGCERSSTRISPQAWSAQRISSAPRRIPAPTDRHRGALPRMPTPGTGCLGAGCRGSGCEARRRVWARAAHALERGARTRYPDLRPRVAPSVRLPLGGQGRARVMLRGPRAWVSGGSVSGAIGARCAQGLVTLVGRGTISSSTCMWSIRVREYPDAYAVTYPCSGAHRPR